MLSDVIGDPMDVIASGPTVPDTATFKTCMDILDKYELVYKIPESVRLRLKAGSAGDIEDTPSPAMRHCPEFRISWSAAMAWQ